VTIFFDNSIKLKCERKQKIHFQDQVQVLNEQLHKKDEKITCLNNDIEKLKREKVNWNTIFNIDKAKANDIQGLTELSTFKQSDKPLTLTEVKGLGQVIFQSNRTYNQRLNYSNFGRTKQCELRSHFMDVFLRLAEIFSNDDRQTFISDLMTHNFNQHFQSTEIWKVEGFTALINNLSEAYNIQESKKDKKRILSIISKCIPSKYILEIFENVTSYQIWQANLLANSSGPGSKTDKKPKKE